MSENSYLLVKNFGEIQYNLILLELKPLSDPEKIPKLQKYWNEFKAIIHVSSEHTEVMHSKYMPLLLAYQKLFNITGGCIPQLEGIDINADTSAIEQEIINYLENKRKTKKCK